jgi:adenine-specific DNA-methyltransferase
VVVDWAIRGKDDSVLDVTTGDGVFPIESARRLRELGSQDQEIGSHLYDTEIGKRPYRKALEEISRPYRISPEGIHNVDFFDFKPDIGGDHDKGRFHKIPLVQAVVGNPPFVKFSLMDERSRKKALVRMESLGFHPKGSIDASALFLIQAASFLRPGGRLAMIMPEMLPFTDYGSSIREYLKTNFTVTLVLCDGWSFEEARERVVLVLATDSVNSGFSVRKLSFGDRDSTGIDALERLGDWKPGELGGSWNKLRFRANHARLLSRTYNHSRGS